jgi:hypothetical protein
MVFRFLGKFGLCTLYADESDDKYIYTISCIAVPTLVSRPLGLRIEWDRYLDGAKAWRRNLRNQFGVPVRKELKGSRLATGHNSYGPHGSRVSGELARGIYQSALATLTFLPLGSIFSVYAVRGAELYGHRKTEAALYALFQRMRSHCNAWKCNALLFFDEGHDEYRTMYRKACVYLPTGSKQGRWEDGKPTKDLRFDTAIKDANFKNSKTSHFIQIADLVAYATLQKARKELGRLSDREVGWRWGDIHDAIPREHLNLDVSDRKDGIVALKVKSAAPPTHAGGRQPTLIR